MNTGEYQKCGNHIMQCCCGVIVVELNVAMESKESNAVVLSWGLMSSPSTATHAGGQLEG